MIRRNCQVPVAAFIAEGSVCKESCLDVLFVELPVPWTAASLNPVEPVETFYLTSRFG